MPVLPTTLPSLPVRAFAAALASLLLAGTADAATYKPKDQRIYHGVSDTGEAADFFAFEDQVRAHPAIDQVFYHWDVPLTTGAFQRWERTDTRGVVSLSTKLPETGNPELSPKRIAIGAGDRYLLALNKTIAERGEPVYIRLFPEMNGWWNPYSAFNADGSRRDGAHATRWFRRAWQRFVIITRGGVRRKVNHRLRERGLPRILRADWNGDRIYERQGVPLVMPKPKVSFMWVPQSTGSPNLHANRPRAYWPGGRFVDWVGLDIYSAYASAAFPKLNTFYDRWDGRPFVIGEYSPWDNDHTGSFTRRLFRWSENHRRVRMLLYYRDVSTTNPHNLQFWPRARRSMRRILDKHRYDPYAPGTRD